MPSRSRTTEACTACVLVCVALVVATSLPHAQSAPLTQTTVEPKIAQKELVSKVLEPSTNSCSICQVVVSVIDMFLKSNVTVDKLEEFVTGVCVQFKLYDKTVCAGMIKELGVEVVTVITETFLPPPVVCHALQLCSGGGLPPRPPMPQQAVHPDPLSLPGAVTKTPPNPKDVGTFLHLSDVHVDPEYTVGMNTQCGEPLCCRPRNGPGKTAASKAPYWGDYLCDSAPWMVDDLLAHMASEFPKVDFIVWTGDNPPHDVWNQTRAGNLGDTKLVTDLIKKHFPQTMVFPAIGNHMPAPVNQFHGPVYDDWMYDTLAEDWGQWLDADALKSLRYSGYYTQLIRDGQRVMVLNSMLGMEDNFWLIRNHTDLGGQLAWMNKTLEAARQAGERVYLIGHIPVSDLGQYPSWAIKQHRIISIYSQSGTIAAMFAGHTHNDQFTVYRDIDTDSKPVQVEWVVPSVTPNGGIDPGFRAYDYDRDTLEVIDYSQYAMNLTEANMRNATKYALLYTMRAEYNLTALRPGDMQNLVHRMSQDVALFNKYHTNYYTRVHRSVMPCNSQCRQGFLCRAATANMPMFTPCVNQTSVAPRLVRQMYESKLCA